MKKIVFLSLVVLGMFACSKNNLTQPLNDEVSAQHESNHDFRSGGITFSKEQIEAHFDRVGIFHNNSLDAFYNTYNVLPISLSQNVNAFFVNQVEQNKAILYANCNYAITDLEYYNYTNALDNEQLDNIELNTGLTLSNDFRDMYLNICTILDEGGSVNNVIENVNKVVNNNFDNLTTDYEQYAIIAMASVAKYSYTYWSVNLDAWSTKYGEGILGKKGGGVAKADALGAVSGAVMGTTVGAVWGGPIGAFAVGIYQSAVSASTASTIAAVAEVAKKNGK